MVSTSLLAGTTNSTPTDAMKECDQPDKEKLLAPFEDLHAVAKAFAKATCQNLIKDYEQSIRNKQFLTVGTPTNLNDLLIKNLEKAFPDSVFPGMSTVTELWKGYTPRKGIYSEDYKGFEFTKILDNGFGSPKYSPQAPRGLPTNYQYEIANKDINEDAMEKHCNSLIANHQDGCEPIIKNLNTIMSQQSLFISKKTSDKVYEQVLAFDKAWDNYTKNSRFQTFADAAFTSWWHRKHFAKKDEFVGPPPYQMFALHPSIVIDHFSKAEKGSKDGVSIALEWGGVNFWNHKIPWGVSVASVYTDRTAGKSIGTGLMFHVNNTFSFGFARRGNNDNSFYVNIEFMDWFGEKQNKLKAYKQKIKKL